MNILPAKLRQIQADLRGGKDVPSESVRELLSWFGVQRRGRLVNRDVRRALRKLALRTEPDFEYEYIDAPLRFVLEELVDNSRTTVTSEPLTEKPPLVAENGLVLSSDVIGEQALVSGATADPTYRIGRLESANTAPLCVKPEDSVTKAVTLMLSHDFSQLPIMANERNVKGIISWRSIGRRMTLGRKCDTVGDCSDPFEVIGRDVSLFAAIPRIVTNEFVLIRGPNGIITGIVTTADISLQFEQLGEPFLLLGEIENHIRLLISDKFTREQLASARDPGDSHREIEDVADLTLGECIRLIEQPDKWATLKLNADRVVFVRQLDEVRNIRNNVMHFDPDGIGPSDHGKLRAFVNFMRILVACGAV